MDDTHRPRKAHWEGRQTGQAIEHALAGSRKLLLTATPLQNALLGL